MKNFLSRSYFLGRQLLFLRAREARVKVWKADGLKRLLTTTKAIPNLKSLTEPSTTTGKMNDVVSETVEFEGTKYTAIREGRAAILTPYLDETVPRPAHKTSKNNNNNTGVQTVFYNKIQQFNRDLSVLAILTHGEGMILEKAAKHQKKNTKRRWEKKKDKFNAKPKDSDDTAGVESEEAAENINKRKREEGEKNPQGDGEHGPTKKTRTSDANSTVEGEPANGHSVENAVKQENGSVQTEGGPGKQRIRYTILDALSATGLRALRYAQEIPFATRVVANDLLPEAVKSIETNVKFNGVEKIVTAHQDDARAFMYSKIGNEANTIDDTYVHRFDAIDLDPYGTAAPFFDSTIQALQDGGLICVTCTDAGVFASNGYPEKAYSLYAGTTMKGVHSHEAGLRLILHAIAMSAAKYGIAVEPLLSLSIDFYARLFIRIHKRPNEVKLLSGTSMLTYNCDSGCGAWTTQKIGRNLAKEAKNGERFFHHSYAQGPSANPNCQHCGFKTHLAGPMWAGPLHNPFFVRAMLAKLPTLDRNIYGTVDRIEGMLKTAIEEDISTKSKKTTEEKATSREATAPAIIPRLPAEAEDPMPFFFIPTFLAKVLHTITPSEAMLRSAFISLGYHVTRSHCKPGSFKTNAPWTVIWEIFREWVRRESPQKEGSLKPGSPGYEIMKRARGTDTAKVIAFKEELLQRLSKISDPNDLKAEMEAGMFRLKELQSNDQKDLTNGQDQSSTEKANGEENIAEKHPSELNIVFDEKLGKENKEKLVRYQINLPHWGPMNRATGRSD